MKRNLCFFGAITIKNNMRTSKSKLLVKEWEDSLNRMSYGELLRITEEPDIYNPTYWELAKKRMEKLASIPEYKIMKDLVKKCLKELGCQCKIDEEGDLDFYFQGENFAIMLREEHHYIDIFDYCWEKISLDDTEEVERLKHAINYANSNSSVTTTYFIDEEMREIGVYSRTSILYRPTITNLKDYLSIRLHNFFLAHDLVNSEMTLMEERDKKKRSELDLSDIDILPVC